MDDLQVNLTDLFPITLYGDGGHGSAITRLFLRSKPANMGWYEVDMIIRSETDVTYKVYGMKCRTYGGRGSLDHTLDVKVDPKELDAWISRKIDRMAKERETYEVVMARQARVKEIAKSYRDQLRRQMRDARKADEKQATPA
ncbi:hypothetical protein [Sulfitobacter sp. R18_1]|uniref:hypothetical protein n=1 Tax=Sulfitobacter sp. R18_1 TaxID=2821104 RepID=UPI001ADD224A|nr:hypothetical protein [Sulfitobacter sp. R18_1]MBO9428140.1 hypothetical protein [Sulfitobacter sp. R18_1]